jgi:hypothetical protein
MGVSGQFSTEIAILTLPSLPCYDLRNLSTTDARDTSPGHLPSREPLLAAKRQACPAISTLTAMFSLRRRRPMKAAGSHRYLRP